MTNQRWKSDEAHSVLVGIERANFELVQAHEQVILDVETKAGRWHWP
jgi:hypothetical protein